MASVSIHAPAWGATFRFATGMNLTGFNPRARMGRDAGESRAYVRGRKFQSTRPHGARQLAHYLILLILIVSIHAPAWGATFDETMLLANQAGFNPRARMGRDRMCMILPNP